MAISLTGTDCAIECDNIRSNSAIVAGSKLIYTPMFGVNNNRTPTNVIKADGTITIPPGIEMHTLSTSNDIDAETNDEIKISDKKNIIGTSMLLKQTSSYTSSQQNLLHSGDILLYGPYPYKESETYSMYFDIDWDNGTFSYQNIYGVTVKLFDITKKKFLATSGDFITFFAFKDFNGNCTLFIRANDSGTTRIATIPLYNPAATGDSGEWYLNCQRFTRLNFSHSVGSFASISNYKLASALTNNGITFYWE